MLLYIYGHQSRPSLATKSHPVREFIKKKKIFRQTHRVPCSRYDLDDSKNIQDKENGERPCFDGCQCFISGSLSFSQRPIPLERLERVKAKSQQGFKNPSVIYGTCDVITNCAMNIDPPSLYPLFRAGLLTATQF